MFNRYIQARLSQQDTVRSQRIQQLIQEEQNRYRGSGAAASGSLGSGGFGQSREVGESLSGDVVARRTEAPVQ